MPRQACSGPRLAHGGLSLLSQKKFYSNCSKVLATVLRPHKAQGAHTSATEPCGVESFVRPQRVTGQ